MLDPVIFPTSDGAVAGDGDDPATVATAATVAGMAATVAGAGDDPATVATAATVAAGDGACPVVTAAGAAMYATACCCFLFVFFLLNFPVALLQICLCYRINSRAVVLLFL